MSNGKPLSPRFETSGPIQAVGLRAHYPWNGPIAIGEQWHKLAALTPRLPRTTRIGYGISYDRPNGFDYVAAMELADGAASVPADISKVTLPAHRYAVFRHDGDTTQIRDTCEAIWRDWAPRSDCDIPKESDGGGFFFERYGEGFDPKTGKGDIEIWVPVK